MDFVLVLPGNLTRQCYPIGLCLLLTWRRRQIFDDLYKVKREDSSKDAVLSSSPVLSHVLLQLDHIALRERQLIAVLALKVEPRHASRTTSKVYSISNIRLIHRVSLFVNASQRFYELYLTLADGGFAFLSGRGFGESD